MLDAVKGGEAVDGEIEAAQRAQRGASVRGCSIPPLGAAMAAASTKALTNSCSDITPVEVFTP